MTLKGNRVLVTGLLALAALGWSPLASAQESSVEWLGSGGAAAVPAPDVEGDATDCEIVVDEFFETVQGYRGTSSTTLGMVLESRTGENPERAGLVAVVYEKSQAPQADESVVVIDRVRTVGLVENAPFRPEEGRRFFVDLATEWNNYGRSFGTREIKRFALFVDLRREGQLVRLWLKNGTQDFEPKDYAKESFFYSYKLPYGYGTRSFLWRDSGSPVFDARENCRS